MHESDPIVVVIDEPVPMLARPRIRASRRRMLRWPTRTLAVAATTLVHVLIFSPLVLGTAAHRSRERPQDGPGSSAWASRGEEEVAMILLDLSAVTPDVTPDQPAPKLDTTRLEEPNLDLVLASMDPKPPTDPKTDGEVADEANVEAGDPAANAALFGRYMGHVSARIDRAWLRPRTALADGHFDCRAQILQDRRGIVLSVSLSNCGDNARWRDSLTAAILSASPLSAPPEPWLFSEELNLNFSADQYEPGVTPDYLYEPVLARVAANEALSFGAGDEGAAQGGLADFPTGGGDVDLTIEGNQIRWTKSPPASDTHEQRPATHR